jgi:hypothetical protein
MSGLPRRNWPLCTAVVLAITILLTVLQFPFPEVRLALWRNPDQIWPDQVRAGQWWRLLTALFVSTTRCG